MMGNYWHLKSCKLFQSCTPDQLQSLEMRCRMKVFSRRSPIYLPADQADSVLLLASGRVKICHLTGEGKQSILALIEPGEIFGELAVIHRGARDEYAEAAEECKVIAIPGESLRELMEQHAELCLGVTKVIGFRRRRIERRVKNLLYLSNRERISHLLLELAEQYGRETEGGIELGIRLSHQDLASIVGSTRETVTVVLGTLQSEGLITIGRRKIVIKAPDRLATEVGAEPLQLLDKGEQPQGAYRLGHSGIRF